MAESIRQGFRGLALYKGQQILRDGLHPGWFERIEQSYYEAIEAFLKSIEKGTPPSPSLEDGLKAQLIADKATESMNTGRPIKITK
jgi:myo-inositol 2-dehydrogenase/D-chiro-inositol 1-dehydrogenase